MNDDREHLIQTLAYQILNSQYDREGKPVMKPLPGIDGVGGARLEIEIKGMVQNMRRQIWLDQGAWTKRIVEELEKQAAEIDLDALIAKNVKNEIERTLQDISDIVRGEIKNQVYDRVRAHLAGIPEMVAREVADRMIKESIPPRSKS